MDTIAPTRERLAKGGIVLPARDQRQSRDYHRQQSPFERLLNREQITQEQSLAGHKLERHMIGATGADVRMTDDGVSDLDGIPAVTRHCNAVASAMAVVPARQWRAIVMLIEQTERLDEIGGAITQRKQPHAAAAAALTLIQEGLDVLVTHWGLTTRRHRPPSR